MLLGEPSAFVRLGAVADHVSEAPAVLDAGLVDGREHGFERGLVAVDVGEDGDPHGVSMARGPQKGRSIVGPCPAARRPPGFAWVPPRSRPSWSPRPPPGCCDRA